MSLDSKKVINCIRESEVYDYSTLMEDSRIGRTIDSQLQMVLPSSTRSYRDRNYIIKDILSKLVEHGELNKSNLISYCGLNLKKHEYIIDYLESNGLIVKNEMFQRKRTISIYKPTEKGSEFCRTILQSYEEMFPRKKLSVLSKIEKNEASNKKLILPK
jgi:predicted transcriptional regulator